MNTIKKDIQIFRGSTFEFEQVVQEKIYNYDPEEHNTTGDKIRTHQENLDFHGFTYAYVDLAATYTKAELNVYQAWIKDGQPAGDQGKSRAAGHGPDHPADVRAHAPRRNGGRRSVR